MTLFIYAYIVLRVSAFFQWETQRNIKPVLVELFWVLINADTLCIIMYEMLLMLTSCRSSWKLHTVWSVFWFCLFITHLVMISRLYFVLYLILYFCLSFSFIKSPLNLKARDITSRPKYIKFVCLYIGFVAITCFMKLV